MVKSKLLLWFLQYLLTKSKNPGLQKGHSLSCKFYFVICRLLHEQTQKPCLKRAQEDSKMAKKNNTF